MSFQSSVERLEARIAPAATFTWDGGGTNDLWTTSANWVGDIVPESGSALIFPEDAQRKSNTNDFADGTVFDSITFTGGPDFSFYLLAGNKIILTNGLKTDGDLQSITLDITLGADQTFTNTGDFSIYSAAVDNPVTFDLNGHTLTLDGSGRYGFDGKIVDTSVTNSGKIIERGEGLLDLRDEGGGAPSQLVSYAGELRLFSEKPTTDVTLEGGHLLRFPSIGSLNVKSGTIEGEAQGRINGDLTIEQGSLLIHRVGIFGPIASVAGTVTLNEPTLALDALQMRDGTEVVLIENDGTDPVIGQFSGLPEGALLTFPTHPDPVPLPFTSQFRITYAGGDGNDVALLVSTPEVKVSTNGKVATFTDVDGDKVTIHATEKSLDPGMFFLSQPNSLGGHQLFGATFRQYPGKVSITAEPGPHGNGKVNVGEIDVELYVPKLRVDGDVAILSAFNGGTFAAKSLGAKWQKTIPEGSHLGPGFVGASGDMSRMNIASNVYGVIRGNLAHLEIGGSLFGAVKLGHTKTITIHGDIHGGKAAGSGSILIGEDEYPPRGANLPSLYVGGSLIGGSGRNSGSVLVPNGAIQHMEIEGSIRAGSSRDSGYGASILAGTMIESLEIHGDIVGTAGNPVTIGANGANLYQTPGPIDVALGKIEVEGDVRYGRFVAGRAFPETRFVVASADASIQKIVVKGDWIASSAIAGVQAGSDQLIGTADDYKLADPGDRPYRDHPQHLSHIGLIRIDGEASGTPAPGDSFGIVAQQIHVVQIGEAIYLPATTAGDPVESIYVGSTGPGPDGERSDFTIHQVR